MANLILWNTLNVRYAPVRPAGAHKLASWLRLHGYTVKVIDFCHRLTTKQLIEITLKNMDNSTLGIGVSSTFWSEIDFLNRAKRNNVFEPPWVVDARTVLEARFPRLNWLLGGAKSVNPFKKFNWIIMHGHGEDALLKWLDEQTIGPKNRPPFNIQTQRCSFLDSDGIQSSEVLPIEFARGCAFKCKFCSYPLVGKKKNTYLRTAPPIEEEIRENYDRFGVTKYFVLDDTVNESNEKLEMMVDIAQRLPFRLEWFGYTRLDLIGTQRHTISQLRDSGMRSTFFGIESLTPATSKIVGKGWNGIHGKEFLLELKETWKDINFQLGFITGLPGETLEDVQNTQQWCIDNKLYGWNWSGLFISRSPSQVWKSEFDLNCQEYGYRFPNPMNDYYWESEHWTARSAVEAADQLNTVAQQYMCPTVWLLGELSCMGYPINELMVTNKKKLPWLDFYNRHEMFIQNYVNLQLNN